MRADPELIASLAGMSREEAVAAIMAGPVSAARATPAERSDETVTWWLRQIGAPGSGLHERMSFFWHGLIPTHRNSVNHHQLVATQLNMIRDNALGNYRNLLQAFVVDGAMIKYLDADSSTAQRPNENLARELMELFSTGIGHYTETDVRQAALAMTGWRVDRDTYAVYFDPERAHTEPVAFMGDTRKWDVASITDRLCDHPATSARISGRLWYHLTGKELNPGAAGALGVWWQDQSLEIRPLVERILLSDDFWADHYARPRSGFEYYAAVQNILGLDPTKLWQARDLGQQLYEPPNVGGWPRGDRWLNPDSMLRRSQTMFSVDFREVSGGTTATLDEILDRCGIHVISDETMAALNAYTDPSDIGEEGVVQLQWRIALSSPEFHLL